jgi:hypothetical protein
MTATHFTIAEGKRSYDVAATTGQTDPSAGIIEARIADNASREAVTQALAELREYLLYAEWPDGDTVAD